MAVLVSSRNLQALLVLSAHVLCYYIFLVFPQSDILQEDLASSCSHLVLTDDYDAGKAEDARNGHPLRKQIKAQP